MRRWFLALALAVFLPFPALAQEGPELPAFFRVTGVAADDRLNIRAEPSARAQIFGQLAPGASGVEVTAFSPDGRWAAVNSGEASGWVSLRYLEAEGGPGWRSGAQALTCLGTEPFWRLELVLPDDRAEFHDPETGGIELRAGPGPYPATQFPSTLAVALSGAREGIAILRGGNCSDGMSDLQYGLEAQVYWHGVARGLSGCCVLSGEVR